MNLEMPCVRWLSASLRGATFFAPARSGTLRSDTAFSSDTAIFSNTALSFDASFFSDAALFSNAAHCSGTASR